MEELHQELLKAARQIRQQIDLGNLSHALHCGQFADPLNGACCCGLEALMETLSRIESLSNNEQVS